MKAIIFMLSVLASRTFVDGYNDNFDTKPLDLDWGGQFKMFKKPIRGDWFGQARIKREK